LLLLDSILDVSERDNLVLANCRVLEIHTLSHLLAELLELGISRDLCALYSYIEWDQLSTIRVDLVDKLLNFLDTEVKGICL
jgi:hypothetical protein